MSNNIRDLLRVKQFFQTKINYTNSNWDLKKIIEKYVSFITKFQGNFLQGYTGFFLYAKDMLQAVIEFSVT